MSLSARVARGKRRIKLYVDYVPGEAMPGTFARALEGAQTDNVSAKTISYVAANVLRDSHYVNGVRTLLLEPSAANLVATPRMTGAGWATSLGLHVGTATGVDGTAAVAERWRANTTNGASQWYRLQAHALGDYSLSYSARPVTNLGRDYRYRIGMYGTPNTNDYTSANIVLPFGVWTRAVLSRNAATAISQYGVQNRSDAVSEDICDFDLFQVETGLIATSPIRTTTTRPSDALSYVESGTLYEKYYDYLGVLQETVRAYVGGTSIAPAAPRSYTVIKLGEGTQSLADMRTAVM